MPQDMLPTAQQEASCRRAAGLLRGVIPLLNEKCISSVLKKLKTLARSSSNNCHIGK